jgi:arylsulfatase A-like enzyme
MNPNIVIIVWDAVRAKNIPFYGYYRNTTPLLDKIRQDFTIYLNAISSSYWTLPSIASLFTGMYPTGHRLLIDGDTISDSLKLLPEILKEHGYHTAAFNRNPYVSEYTGLNKGFKDFIYDAKCLWDYLKKIEKILKIQQSTDPRVLQNLDIHNANRQNKSELIQVLKHIPDVFVDSGSAGMIKKFSRWIKNRAKQPFFAFIQCLETHSPYRFPIRFALSFLSIKKLLKKPFVNHDHMSYLLGYSNMTEDDFDILKGAYDTAIRYSDFITYKIIEMLKRNKTYDNTIIIILSDHGESLGEHSLMFHIWSLYDNLIKVPLLIKYPKGHSSDPENEDIVQNVDIMPSILSLLKINQPDLQRQIQGNAIDGNYYRNRVRNLAISELIKPFGPDKIAYRDLLKKWDRRLVSVRAKDKKVIYSSRGDHELYNLDQDPDELNNLFIKDFENDSIFQVAKKQYQKVEQFYNTHLEKLQGQQVHQLNNQDIKDRLKDLGYL